MNGYIGIMAFREWNRQRERKGTGKDEELGRLYGYTGSSSPRWARGRWDTLSLDIRYCIAASTTTTIIIYCDLAGSLISASLLLGQGRLGNGEFRRGFREHRE